MTYELVYLNLRGRAEVIRLLLALAGQAYTDTRVPFPLSPEQKEGSPLGQLPWLVERDGEQERRIPQTFAILRHLGRVHGLYGADEDQRTACDVVGETLADLRVVYVWAKFGPGSREPGGRERLLREMWPPHRDRIRRLLARGPGTGWFVSDAPTWADVAAFDGLDAMLEFSADALDGAPELRAFVDRFASLPRIAAWLSARA